MITVQASGRKLIENGKPECMEILDSNDDGLAYLADAMTAIGAIIAHAECKFGQIITELLLSAMESGTLRDAINKGRGEEANENQTGDCPGC